MVIGGRAARYPCHASCIMQLGPVAQLVAQPAYTG